jgi:NADH-quinone oxidoreductase subunit N
MSTRARPRRRPLIASASKLAGFTLFTRLLWPGLGARAGNVSTTCQGRARLAAGRGGVSAASLLLGNFGALAQSNVRRLLAYSAIAHAGALLLGVIAAAGRPGAALLLRGDLRPRHGRRVRRHRRVERRGRCQKLTDLAGLHRRSPLLAGCLAGVHPVARGHSAARRFLRQVPSSPPRCKSAASAGPAGWLALLAIALSAVALYYYLIVLKQALVVPLTMPFAGNAAFIPAPRESWPPSRMPASPSPSSRPTARKRSTR